MSTLAQLRTAAPSTEILTDGWRYSIGDRGGEGAMRFYVDAPELQAFVDVLAGKPPVTVNIGGSNVQRLIPLQFPRDLTCYAYSADIYAPDGVIATPGAYVDEAVPANSYDWGIDYQFYFADVRFRVPTYSLDGDFPTVTRSRDAGVEMRTRPGTAYKYPSDGLVIAHDVGVPVQVAQYALTFSGLQALDDELYDDLLGCVNATTFMGKPPGTVLYLGCASQGVMRLGGVPSYQATQRFAYCKVPHRMLMRPDGAGFESPVQVGDATKYLLDEADLNQLYA
jgi:hypothetical protein